MEIDKIQELIKFVAQSGASEVKLEMEDVKITIKTKSGEEKETTIIQQVPGFGMQQGMPNPQAVQQSPQSNPAQQPATPEKETEESEEESKYITVKSPIIGTFYRKPAPEKPVFIEVGDTIKEGDVLCVVEAMKLFNEIESEVSGKIVKVLVDDASPVEFDQPLFLVDPS